jgi:hypothetical protein
MVRLSVEGTLAYASLCVELNSVAGAFRRETRHGKFKKD